MPHQAAFGVVRICPWTQSLNPPPRTFYFIPSTWIHFVTADWSGGFHGWNALCHKKSMLALWLFWLHHCYCVSLTTCRDIVAKTVVSVSLVPPVPEQKTHKNWHVRPIDTLTHRSDAHIAAGQSEPLCCWTQTFCDVVIRVWSSSWSSRCRNKMDEWPVLFLLFRPQHTCQRLNNIAMLDLPPRNLQRAQPCHAARSDVLLSSWVAVGSSTQLQHHNRKRLHVPGMLLGNLFEQCDSNYFTMQSENVRNLSAFKRPRPNLLHFCEASSTRLFFCSVKNFLES